MAPTCHEPGAHGDLYACRACGTILQPALPSGPALLDLYRERGLLIEADGMGEVGEVSERVLAALAQRLGR